MTQRCLALLVALAWMSPALAEDESTKRIALPHAAVSLDVPHGWDITQHDGSVIDIRKDGARLWAYAGERGDSASKRVQRYAQRVGGTVELWKVPGMRDGSRVWVEENGEQRMLGALTRDDDSGMDAEALVPKDKPKLRDEINAICDSFDINPFVHPTRLVDWTQTWTLDLAKGWTPTGTAQGFARLRPADRKDFDAYVHRKAIKAQFPGAAKALRKFKDHDISAPRGMQVTKEGAEVHYDLTPKTGKGNAVRLWTRSHQEVEAVFVHPWSDAPSDELKQAVDAALAMFRTLRGSTDPGPQRDLAKERAPNRFPREDGPPLTFELPSRWILQKPSTDTRLAQVVIPGNPRTLIAVVYWFGPKQGGNVKQNIARWTGQFVTHDRPMDSKTLQVAEGVRATILDIQGTYAGGGRPQAAEQVKRPNQRMLATVLDVPQGPLFIKLVGDARAVNKIGKAYVAWIASFRVAP